MLCREQQMIVKPAALLVQGTFSRHPRDLRMIVLLRKMRQDEELSSPIIVARQEIREGIVGEVTNAAHHTLLHAPRIRSAAQHLEVVIGFDHQHMAAAQVMPHAGRHVAEIGADANLDTIARKREADGIDGIMRNGERSYRDVADLKSAAGAEVLPTCNRDAVAGAVASELAVGVISR